jgi:hypothetical protein
MPQYERLSEERRNSRRTIADAIEVLHDKAGFAERDHAQIRIGPFRLPSGEVVGLVQICFDSLTNDKVYVVSLPSSRQFYGRRPNSPEGGRFDIEQLHGAVLDETGHVLLTDGETLRAVEVIPARLPLEPSKLDWRIVHHTISYIGAEERCYRSLGDDLPDRSKDMVADLRFLDCSKLSGLDIPSLDAIAAHIAERDRRLRRLSQQKIADALRKFGIRVPRPRLRVRSRHTAVTI